MPSASTARGIVCRSTHRILECICYRVNQGGRRCQPSHNLRHGTRSATMADRRRNVSTSNQVAGSVHNSDGNPCRRRDDSRCKRVLGACGIPNRRRSALKARKDLFQGSSRHGSNPEGPKRAALDGPSTGKADRFLRNGHEKIVRLDGVGPAKIAQSTYFPSESAGDSICSRAYATAERISGFGS